ncbi:putative coproporphyrinogen oxidase [Helianthus annuus]|nr:putative coproporphyrinogen oxidase [Helianthus annuus]
MIEKETAETHRPDTFLRDSDGGSSVEAGSIRARFEKMIREAQDSVCAAIEAADGGAKFKEDVCVSAGWGWWDK